MLRRALRAFLDAPHLLLLLWASLLTLHLLHLALELSLHVLLLLDMLALHLVHPRLLLPLQLRKIRTGPGVLRLRRHDVLQIAGGTSLRLRAPALLFAWLVLLLVLRSCALLSLLLHLPRLLLLLLHLLLHLLHLHLLLLLHLHRLHLHLLLHLPLHSLLLLLRRRLLLRWRHLLLRWWHLLLRWWHLLWLLFECHESTKPRLLGCLRSSQHFGCVPVFPLVLIARSERLHVIAECIIIGVVCIIGRFNKELLCATLLASFGELGLERRSQVGVTKTGP